MQPQGSHAKPSIRRVTNGRVVLSDDEDDQVAAPRPAAPALAGPSQPRNSTPTVHDAGRSSEAPRARYAGEPNQPHARRNAQTLNLAIRKHLEPQQPRSVPQKRKEHVIAAAGPGPSSVNGTTAGDEPTSIPDDQSRAAKRVRHSPPAPAPTLTSAEALAAAFDAKAPSAASAPAVLTTAVANPVVTSLPAVPLDTPPADDRPPPPPPLMPFKRPKPSPSPSTDSTPAGGSAKRKRALSYGPGDDVSAKDQAAPVPLPPKKKVKSVLAILAESESRAKDEASRPRSHTPIPGPAASPSTSRPMTPTAVADSKPRHTPLEPKKEASTPSHTQPSIVANRVDEKRKAAEAPAPHPLHRDRVDVEKDASFRRPAPKVVARPDKVKSEDIDRDVPVPQSSRPGAPNVSREEKGKARVKVEGNTSKSRPVNEERQPEKKVKARAPPEPDATPPAAPKKKKLLPLSSILTQAEERKLKEQSATRPLEPPSRESGDVLPRSASKLPEHPPPERPVNTSSVVVPESTRTRPAPPPTSASRPSPPESATPPAPPPRKKKLLPISSIVKESEQRQQGAALAAPRPAENAGKLAPAEAISTSNRAIPRQPEFLSAPHPTDNMHTPPALAQTSLPGPAIDESPRTMMAIKRASSELSHIGAFNPGQLQHKPMHALDALLMLADTAAMAPSVPKVQQERFSSESRRESSSDTTLSARERALQRAQSELAHTEGHVDFSKRKTPRRKLSELLEDDDNYPEVEDNSQARNNAAIVTDTPKHNRAASPQPLLGLLGLGAYGSSPEPEEDEPASPIRLVSPSVEIGQSRASDTPKQSSPSAAVNSQAPSTDLPLKPHSSLLDPGSPPSVVQSTLHEQHTAPSPPPRQEPPPHARPEQRRVSSRMVIHSPESGAEEYSSPHTLPAQSASPQQGRKRSRSRSSSPAWPAEPASEAPAPEPAAQETAAPAPAPAKKKYGSFKKIKQPSFEEQTPPAPAREPEKEKAPAPPKRVPAHLPPKPAGLPPKPTAAPAAAPTPFGRQLPPEHSSRDLDPTSVLSAVLGKPKRDSGITPEQRREWDQRKAADRAAREAEYAAQGPPLRMQKQMQTIIQFENKFKAKRTNVAPNIVAAAFKQRWEKTHGPWMPPMPGRRPQQEPGPPSSAHGRPLPPTPNDRAHVKSSSQGPPPALWRPLNGGAR